MQNLDLIATPGGTSQRIAISAVSAAFAATPVGADAVALIVSVLSYVRVGGGPALASGVDTVLLPNTRYLIGVPRGAVVNVIADGVGAGFAYLTPQ